jgi:peptidoglycan/xylan/chitin deacetylase (PgdA/CDA1 family)
MFFDLDIKGDRLAPKTVCLTYDDGPGPHTRALGRYLFEQGIGATFFAVGRHAEGHADLLRQLRRWGHLVGNHTYSHPGLVGVATSGGDVVGEVARADAILRAGAPRGPVFFRAPYGNWREKVATGSPQDRRVSVVAGLLNRSGQFAHYVGPINWDISSHDWEYWERGAPAARCAAYCLRRVEEVGRGIILMHDSSENEAVRANNRTYQATRLLVPALRAKGYRFVRLDTIPQVRSARRVTDQITLGDANGRLVSCPAVGRGFVLVEPSEQTREVFGVVPLRRGRVALRTADGRFLSVRDGSEGEVVAGPVRAGAREALRLKELGGDRVALLTPDGRRLTCGRDGRLTAGRRGGTFGFRRDYATT